MTGAIEDLYPLSPTQQGLLFHSLRSTSAVYVEQQVLEIDGAIDAEAWERAWAIVLDRHPALRTSFVWERLERPLQAVHRGARVPLVRLDWRDLDEGEQRRRLAELLAAERERPFDLKRAPLLRQTLVALGAERHVLIWAFHHLILDGWSRALVMRDLTVAYESCRLGRAPELPAAPAYRTFIAWLGQRDLAAAESFWRRELAGIERPTALPWRGDPGAARRAGAGDSATAAAARGVEEASLSPAGTAALRDFARRHRLTLNTLAQGAWALWLARASGDEEVVFGATVAGRPPELPGIEEAVGLFLNTLPVRVRVAAGAPLVPWLQALQERQVEARAHEQTPLVEIQGWSGVPRDQPLFESVLVFESYPRPEAPEGDDEAADALRARLHPDAGIGHTNYPLALVVGAEPVLGWRAAHDRSRLSKDDAARLLAHLGRLLEGMIEAPERPLDALSPLRPEERRELVAWGGEARALPFVPIARLVLEQARRTPERAALCCGDAVLDYRSLARAVERLAERLRRQGVGAERVVAVAAERALDTPIALLAALAAGGVYFPFDPAQPEGRLAELFAAAEPTVLVARQGAAARFAALAPGAPAMVALDAPAPGPETELDGAPPDEPEPAAHDAACLFFTSGSTGRPKGVVVEQRQLAHTLAACRDFGFDADDRVLVLAPLSFDISLFELLNPLLAGGAAVLVPREDLLDAERLAAAAAGATVLHAVPALLRELVEHARGSGRTFPTLRAVFTGGDAVPADLLAAARAVFPHARLRVLYGPTEGTIICSAHTVADDPGSLALGRPLSGVVLAVVDRFGAPVPIGIPGEILLGGGGVARGYLGLPEQTAERFVEIGGERFYRTGDRARYTRDGELWFAGRADDQVKIRGVRVEPREVEAVLARHPRVREAVVQARELERGRERRLVAWVTVSGDDPPAPDELRRFAASLLPDALVPAAIAVLDALPLTPHGKVDRAALPAPEVGGSGRAASTPLEERMAALWSQILGVESVGMDDDFFALGGHSLLAIQVLSRVRSAFGAELSLRALFDAPTPAGMLAAVAASRGDGAGPGGAETGEPTKSTEPTEPTEPAPAPPSSIARLSRAGHRMRRDALEVE